jgi:AraC family transcriptional regulator
MMHEKLIPRIEMFPGKTLTGMKITTSLINNKTGVLWKTFMPRLKEIGNQKGTERYSVQEYPENYFEDFDPATGFEKWAAVEVDDPAERPAGMESFTIPAGLYAIFHYKGSSLNSRIFQYIYSEWLPASEYLLDNRPHFEILGEKYKNADPDSEEDIYIPVKPR